MAGADVAHRISYNAVSGSSNLFTNNRLRRNAFRRGSSPGRRVFLFTDWHHVKKGELAIVLDPARMSDAGHKLQTSLAKDFNRTFDTGAGGFRPKDLPVGVRIVQEKAQRSDPFLSIDQPWEKMV
ncbi:MAG: hypothetical protein ABIZ80_17470, partial [Bryobacteraceae bacterium]